MLIEKVKVANRITRADKGLEEELTDLINAAILDLEIAGVDTKGISPKKEAPDPLITRAVTLYTKAHFGFDNPEAERFSNAYLMLKQHLCLSEDYKKDVI